MMPLNQKVLYLVLLITLLYGLTSANQNITIYVQEDGIDQSGCMEGNESIPCNTLSYILNQINNRSNDTFNGTNISVYVYITYYQEITNLSHIQLLVNLYLIGLGNPVLNFSGNYNSLFNLDLCHGGSIYAERITFYKIRASFYCLATVSFNKCIFTSGDSALTDFEILNVEGVHNFTISNCLFHNNSELLLALMEIDSAEISGCKFYQTKINFYLIWIGFKQVHNLTISNCLFHNNDVQSALIEIQNVSNVEISECEFYQSKSQDSLIWINSEQLYNLTISNCLFHNNNVQSVIIKIENVSNVEMSGCEFYQSKSQNDLIWISSEHIYNLIIRDCLFHNNDAQLVLIEIEYVTNVEISGCEFYQSKSLDDLIWIGSEQVHNLTISDCLFHNNDAQVTLIEIDNAFNVELSGCEFYQNEGQNYLIVSSLSYFVHMDNCSIYGNDIKDAILVLDSSKSESMFTITNCLFSNNTSGGNILEITSNRLHMSNINLISNKIKWIEYSIIRITPILTSYKQNLIIHNINFINNTGTGLKLKEVIAYLNNITFYNNTGVYGGGMSLYHTQIWLAGPLIFERNTALFGGAIYIATTEIFLYAYCTSFEEIIFSSNFAGTLGNDAYIEDGFSVSEIIYFTFPCIHYISNHVRGDYIISGPYNITINPQNNSTITLFPGQKLTYSAKVTDYFGNLTSCLVNINLKCGNNFCEHVQLTGETQSLLSTSNFTTNRYLTSNVEHHDYSLKLRFVCLDTNAEVYANVNLTICPLGYVFQISQPIQGTCECVDIASDDVQCNLVLGVACIRHGYWLDKANADNAMEDTLIDTAPCQYPYCKTDLPPCPIIGLSQTYNRLPITQDEQCNGLYGGLLCRSCREDAVFSFEAVNCIPSSNCEPWQPYVTLVLVVVFQLVLGFGIVIGLKASFKTGIGHLYGPLFFIAVLRLVPFGYYKEYVQLEFTVSIFQSVLLLNLEVFGKVPWCFFSNINPLLNYSLHFLGPFIIAVVLLSTVFLARYYPRQFLSLQSSPVQAICLLILLSFWSVTDTCIQLLKPTTTLSGVKGWRVALQPNIQYLKDPYHIVTWIVSTVLLVFLLVPFILLLFLSPLLRRKFNLTRIQPLLDAFQSCYDDKYRWYSGVYLLSWLILNINMPYYVMEIILVAVSTLHFMIHPYKYRWLNIVDTLLLVDLNLFVSLTSADSPSSINKRTVLISYILVVLPLTYITIGGVWIISAIIIKWGKRKVYTGKNANKEELVNLLDEEEEEVVDSGDRDIHIGVSSTVIEHPGCRRESLIFDDN